MRKLVTLILFAVAGNSFAVELSKSEKNLLVTIESTIRSAGKAYAEEKYDQAGELLCQAMEQVDSAIQTGSPELLDALTPAIKRIARAHTLLEFESITLPPIQTPSRPPKNSRSEMADAADKSIPQRVPPKPTNSSVTMRQPTMPENGQISFTESVAPILVSRCGNCHITQSKGNFSMASYATLMKGPPEGVVIFAGDTAGSRLIETIESGDMPRGGGKLTTAELAVLKAWIQSGAKFDGVNSDAPLDNSPAPTMTDPSPMPTVVRTTGNETVQFSKDVAPLLIDNCKGCHLEAMATSGGLRMDTFAQLLRGGDSGSIVQPGNAAASLLIKKLRGTEGQRMPAGGRPPLADESIDRIAKWIDEGAKLDAASDTQPLTVMSQLAWASSATPAQISERRQVEAQKNLNLVISSGVEFQSVETKHFFVIGPLSQETIDLVAQRAESNMKTVAGLISKTDREVYRGRATIVALPKRYDYSEFTKMIEQRSLPADWVGHWKFDGLDAYVVIVVSDGDDGKAIEGRLAAPLVSLAVATQGSDIPYWFAQGVGSVATRKKVNRRDRESLQKAEAELIEAVSAFQSAEQFLAGNLTPEQTERTADALVGSMMEGKRRREFDGLMRQLQQGKSFDEAFADSYRIPVEQYIGAWRGSLGR